MLELLDGCAGGQIARDLEKKDKDERKASQAGGAECNGHRRDRAGSIGNKMKVDGQEKSGRGWHEMCSKRQASSGSPLHNRIRNQNLLSQSSEKSMRILTDLTDISTVFLQLLCDKWGTMGQK